MKRQAKPIRMIVLFTARPDADVIGLQAVPDRLPQVLRFPGESQTSLRLRARAMVQGGGSILVLPLLRH